LLNIDERKIILLRNEKSPIHERELEELLHTGKRPIEVYLLVGRFDSVSDIVMIAVDTPAKMNGEANTYYVEEAVRSFAERLQDGEHIMLWW